MKKHYSNYSRKKKTARKPLMTALESRLLLDGAAVATAIDVLTDSQLYNEAFHSDVSQSDSAMSLVIAPTEVRALDASLNNGKKEVVFIEDNVTDYQTLIDGAKEGVEVVLLDSTQDGLAQMVQWAQTHSGYDAIHLITHGAEGQIDLGDLKLNSTVLNSREADLSVLGAALNKEGDLLLYGCEVAGGEGQNFIKALAQATQADVAASDDLTGAEVLGGDWDLELTTGSVETENVLSVTAQASFQDTLADVVVGNNGTALDSSSSGGVTIGQSFTATKTGVLTDVQVVAFGSDSGDGIILDIYSGEGLGGTKIHTQTFSTLGTTYTTATDYTFATLTLDTSIALTSGSVYTFNFSVATSQDLAYAANTSYTGGNLYFSGGVQSGYDMVFQVTQGDLPVSGPTVTGVTSSTANGSYKVGDQVSIQVGFSEAVTVSGTPQLVLETGTTDRTLDYVSGSGGTALTFTYTVQTGDTSADLDYLSTSALALNSGTINATSGGAAAVLTLASPGASESLGDSKAIVIDTTAPGAATTPDMTAGTDSGTLSTDNITNDTTPTFTGTAESGATVTLYDTDGTTVLGTGTATGGNWSITSSVLSAGSHTITAKVTDVAGNVSSASSGLAVTIDAVAPTLASSSPADGTTSVAPSSDITLTFAEDIIKGYDTIKLVNVTTGTTVETFDVLNGGNLTYSGNTVTLNPTSDLDEATAYAIQVDANAVRDAAGNNYAGISDSTTLNFTTGVTDSVAPTFLSIQRANDNVVVASSTSFTLAFNEAVNASAADFALLATGGVAGTIGSITGSGSNTLTVNVTGISGVGTLGLNLASSHTIKDLAGNALATAEPTDDEVYVVDTLAPTLVSINRLDSATTNADSVQFMVVFSETVTGLATDDFELTGTATSGASIASVTGSGNGYLITVSGVSGDGTLGVQLKSAATISDSATNALTATTASAMTETYSIDNTAPTATAIITTAISSNMALSSADTVTFDVTFNEAVANVTVDDFEISGDVSGTISAISGSGSSYTVTVSSIMGDGVLGLNFKSSQNIADSVGNSFAGTDPSIDESYTIDNTLPTVTSISRGMVNQVKASTATDVVFTVVMSEAVTGMATGDFSVTGNATNTGVSSVSSADGKVFKVSVGGVNGTIGQTVGLSFTGSASDALSQASTAQFTSGDSYTIAGTLLNEGALTQEQLDAIVDLNREGTLLAQSVSGAKEVVIIDSRVPGLVELTKQSTANADIWLLNGSRSAIQQISEILANYNDLDALHILSHGGVGNVFLGAETLSADVISQNTGTFAAWGNTLYDSGDILLYGCNVAQGETGLAFINQLAQVTGADIAASDDLTGSEVLGGDWDLELTTGSVETENVLSVTAQASFQDTLADVVVGNNGTALDSSSSGGVTIGQSFTATKTGVLTDVQVVAFGSDSGDGIILDIYSGEGLGGTKIHTQTFSTLGTTYTTATDYTFATLTLDTSIALTSGSVYTFNFSVATSQDLAYAANTSYTGGNLYFSGGVQSGYDMVFQVTQGDLPVSGPTVTSATYDASSNSLIIAGTGMTATSGATNDINVSKLTLTGDGGATYTLTSSSVEIDSATQFTVALNAADQTRVEGLLNKNGAISVDNTTFNIAAADNWNSANAGNADLTGNAVTVSNVQTPTITSSTYDASTGILVVTGTNLVNADGATNDITANKFTFTGDSSAYTLTNTSNVEITSATEFTITLSATDKAAAATRLNNNGTSSTGSATYNLAVADDWNTVITAGDISDATGNAITVSGVNQAPTVSGAVVSQGVNDTATVLPFSNVTLADANDDNVSITVALDTAAKGAFTAASLTTSGFVDAGSGSYTLTSRTLASAQTALRALVFDATNNRVAVGSTETTTFTITVNDGTVDSTNNITTVASTSINDTPTDIALSDAAYSHSEGSSNIAVGSFSATDADTGESFAYTLVSGTGDTDNGKFNINGTDLRVTDRVNVPAGTYSIRVQVSDGDATFEKAFTITVTDDVTPTVSSVVPTDNTTGVSVADAIQITFDENIQLGSTGTIVLYDITGGGANSVTIDVANHSSQLSISGQVLTIDPSSNLLATNQYAVQFTAGALKDSANNGVAAINSTTSFNFTTGTVDTTAPTVAIVDIIDPTQPNAGTVSINFSEQVTGVDISDFTLTKDGSAVTLTGLTVGGSGSAYTLDLSTITATAGTYVLTLNTSNITDTSGNALSAGDSETFIIDTTVPTGVAIVRASAALTNGNSATFTAIFSEVVSGVDTADFTLTGTATGGSISSITQVSDSVYTVSVTGISADGTLGVDLNSSGTGITDTAGNAINGGKTGQLITRDTTGPSVLSINRDGAVLTTADSATFTVSFDEAASGIDASDFSLSGGATGTIASVTGSGNTYQVTVNSISGDGSLRLDLKASGTSIVDGANNAVTSGFTSGDSLTIDNTAATVTVSQSFNLDEGMATGTIIGQVKATDTNGVAQFTIQSGNDNGYFSIDNSGVLTLTSAGSAAIDYETATSYSLNIVATDALGQSSSAVAMTIAVQDINDNTPVISSAATAALAENAVTTTVVYDANATDGDSSSAYNSLTYSLKATNDHNAFTIDGSTGEVKLKAVADYETKSSYSFTVIASDGMRSVEKGVTLSISDVNDNTPVITSGATGSVDENAATTTTIYTATGTDADGTTANNTLTYSLSGADAALLDINSTTGVVTLKASADYESKTSYSFNVVATDNGAGNFNSGSLNVSEAVTVSVNDLNDNTPVITSGATGSVDENAATTTVFYTATGTDADGTTANNTLTYNLSGTDAALLDINATTGVVTLKASADYESKTSYSFNVVATDNGVGNFNSGSLNVSEAVTVSVNDLNDNTPVITSGATGSVDENAATTTVFYTATGTDADGTAANSTLTYSLSGTDAALLAINGTTGAVTLKASADYETKTSYSFNVVATDNGTGNLNSDKAVTVSVNDLNDNTPVITSGATGSVDENAATTTTIYTATGTDADGTTANKTLTYNLSGTDAALLAINARTGAVTLKASADYETKSSYSFNVVATDNGTGNLNSDKAVTVSVNDLNDNTPVITSASTGSVNENAATTTTIYTTTTGFEAPAPNLNVASLPLGTIANSNAGNSGFAAETGGAASNTGTNTPTTEPTEASSTGTNTPTTEPTAAPTEANRANTLPAPVIDRTTTSQTRVSVNVDQSGQVQVTQEANAPVSTTGLTVATLVTQSNRVSITIEDSGASVNYSATMSDGADLPNWVEINPTTGEVSMTPPVGQGKITLKINAVDIDGNTRVLEIDVDLDSLPTIIEGAPVESPTTDNTVTFISLDEQLTLAAEEFDDYGKGLLNLLVS